MWRIKNRINKTGLIFSFLMLATLALPQALRAQENGAQVRHLSALAPSSVSFTLTYIEDLNSGLIALIALRTEALTLEGGDVTLDQGIEMFLPPQAKDFNPTPNPDNIMS